MTDVLIPAGRDVRASLKDPGDAIAGVVACPPHPGHGGSRDDRRLIAVSEALSKRGIACLRFDYGAWDEGYGEREDARNAIRWVDERYDRVGAFGFSFGAAIAVLAGAGLADREGVGEVCALSILAPPARVAADLEVVPALDRLDCPVQVRYGERDTTVDWDPVVEQARELELDVEGLPADHFFVGQGGAIAATVGTFLETHLE